MVKTLLTVKINLKKLSKQGVTINSDTKKAAIRPLLKFIGT